MEEINKLFMILTFVHQWRMNVAANMLYSIFLREKKKFFFGNQRLQMTYGIA